MKRIMISGLVVLLLSFMLTTESCKSGKLDCPTYSDNPAPTGIPKSGKSKSSVFPPDYRKGK